MMGNYLVRFLGGNPAARPVTYPESFLTSMYSRIWKSKDGRDVLIREAEASDSRQVLEYLELVSAETDFLTFGPGEFGLSEHQESEYLENCRSAENCLYLLALIEGNLVGILSFCAGNRSRVRHTGEFSASVLQSYWGIGIASALMDSLVEWARSIEIIKKINLRVRTDNHRAIALYTHKGFTVEGTVKKEMYVNGVYYDNLLMGLDIEGYKTIKISRSENRAADLHRYTR